MKKCKSIFTALLALVMLLCNLSGAMLNVQAATTGYTTGTATVYDLYDLTGEETKTIFGRIQTGTWDQQLGTVAEEHKGNVAFTTKMTVGSEYEHIFVGLGMTGANASSTTDGYIFEIQAKAGEPDAVVYHKKDASWQASSQGLSFDFNGTYVLEAGVVDLYENGTLVGKRAYLKANGEEICHYDDTATPVTTENLGTVVGIYNEQNNITMETTYTTSYGTEKVYTLYDLTGENSQTYNGTKNGNWSASVIGNIAAADKENVSFKTTITIEDEAIYRFSLGALESDGCIDPAGYGIEINVAQSGYVRFTRGSNQTQLAAWSDIDTTGLVGTYEFEIGYRDILFGGKRIGKQVFLKANGVELYTYDDLDGYLTGDTLGTKVALFHYGTAVEMGTPKTYGDAAVYDLYDLTGAVVMQRGPWANDNLSLQKIGSVDAADKEQVAFKFKLNITDESQRYRFSLGAQEDANCIDPKGYGLEIGIRFDSNPYERSYITFLRNGTVLKNSWSIDDIDFYKMLGEHEFEFGYRNITVGDEITGKQVYLKMDGEVLYTCDDLDGYLTGDALGTKVALHYSADTNAQLESTYDFACYDVTDLNKETNTYNGTGNGNWSASVIGNIDAADKENVSFKAKVTITDEAIYRFSLAALDSDDCVDPAGYGFQLDLGTSGYMAFIRGSSHTWLWSWSEDTTALKGECEIEFGYRTIIIADNSIGKQVFMKVNGVERYTYNDVSGYLTGDALGTKVALFHYGTAVQMDATTEHTHSYTSETIAPDCLNDGKILYTCTVCGHTYTEASGEAALGHNYEHTVTAPTCTAQGYTTHVCSGCGDTYKDTYVNALGHTVVIDAAVAPTCTATGLTEGKHCSVCNTVLVAQQTVAATGHSYNAVVTDPDCTNKGYTTYTCTACGNTYTDNEVAANGHSYNAVVTAPTCTAAGYTTYTCSVCSDTYTDDEVAATGHTEVVDAAVAATCTATGLTEGKHCSVCDEVLIAQEVVAATGHTYAGKAEVINDIPTITYNCSVCGQSEHKIELNFYGSTVYMGNTLAVYYYIDRDIDGIEISEDETLPGFTDISVNFSYGERKVHYDEEGNVTNDYSLTVSLDEDVKTNEKYYNDTHYKFPCRYISPSQIGDEITAVISGKFGKDTFTFTMTGYSVKQYCLNRIKASDSTETEQKMLVDMLYYCDASRAYTTYKANESVTGDLAAYASAHAERVAAVSCENVLNAAYVDITDEKATWVAASVELSGGSVRIRLRCKPVDGVSIGEVTAKAIVNEEAVETYVKQEDGVYYVYVLDLAYAQLSVPVYVTLYEGDTAISDTICYSVESYAATMLDNTNEKLDALLKAMMCYGDSAKAYFDTKNT